MTKKEYIKNRFQKESIELTENQLEQFYIYYSLLTEWNSIMNLTAITEFEEVVEKHFIDSILIKDILQMDRINSIIDIGTGAGFPGIPLKILFPEKKILLVDSLQKRISFLNVVIEKLSLDGIKAVHARAEEQSHKEEQREKYDLCVSRAVARLTSLCELCIPYVKVNGYFIAYKSQKAEEELLEAEKAIRQLGAVSEKMKSCFIKNDVIRNFIIIKKIKSTDKKYPRGGGKPWKAPIM